MPRFPREGPDPICRFPKHKGERWEDIVKDDPEYVEFILSGEGPHLDEEQYDYIMELLEES
jgi:hypothetical protein